MKSLIIFLFLITAPALSFQAYSQTYTTESKSCGSCQKKVSNNSKIGMYCPHCGVRWGYENERRSTSTNYSYDNHNSYDNYEYKSTGFTSSRVNLRSGPSKKSFVKTVIPSYTSLSILSSNGNWYYVSYDYFDGYALRTIKGYVHKSLI
jgi:predicted RNA-binding Zn-ribbon protein involved in translation (DUF1610 family)